MHEEGWVMDSVRVEVRTGKRILRRVDGASVRRTMAAVPPGGESVRERAIRFVCEQNSPTRDMKHRLVYLLNVGQRRLHRWSYARTAAGGVTAAQSGLLFFLGTHDGALMSEAAAALQMGAPGMSGLADRTERAGLIERRPDDADGRASRLWLTPAGRSARQRSQAGLKDLNARLTEGFTAAEIDVVARWLTSLQEKFPPADEDEI
jgi:DNA-binding MarR family transcriptional regulator